MHRKNLTGITFIIAVLVCSLAVAAQQQAPSSQSQPPKPEAAIITFMGEISTQSMGQLIAVTNSQVIAAGIKKLTLAIASGGGDTTAAFATYNYLRNQKQIELTTFNVGNVDSAAVILYCAGENRFSLPATRFLIHGNSFNVVGNASMDAGILQARLGLIANLDTMVAQVINDATKSKMAKEVDTAIHGQTILTPEEAQKWGLVQAIKSSFVEPGVPVFSIANASPGENPQYKVSSVTPPSSNSTKH